MKKIFKEEVIIKYIQEHNLTKKQFCKECGISITTLNSILKGQNNINLKTILKLIVYMKVYARDILTF